MGGVSRCKARPVLGGLTSSSLVVLPKNYQPFLMIVSDYFPLLISLFALSYIAGFGVGLLLNGLNYVFKAFRI